VWNLENFSAEIAEMTTGTEKTRSLLKNPEKKKERKETGTNKARLERLENIPNPSMTRRCHLSGNMRKLQRNVIPPNRK
jgi:hypothetical protein